MSQPSSSQPIDWEPTPPKPKPKAPKRDNAARMKFIEQALAEAAQKPAPSQPTPLTTSSVPNKRPSTDDITGNNATAKKARVLPPGYAKQSIVASTSPSSRSTPAAQSNTPSSSAPRSKSKLAGVFLSKEQSHILRLVQEGNSLFYTGSAGTGKSVLLREIIKVLRMKFSRNPDSLGITASTGIAACNIGGQTIHSWAGIGLGVESAEELASKIRKNKKSVTRWARTRVLIIDEISMLDGNLFDKLAKIAKMLKKSPEPFGGIQVVITGDFFQLPPVSRTQPKFAFEAELWTESIKHTFNLTKVFRQSDPRFVDMLNEMRFGTLSQRSIDEFKKLSRDLQFNDNIEPTELYPMREGVDSANRARLRALGSLQSYAAMESGTITDPTQREKILSNFMAPKHLELAINAQVMLIKNVDETLVNGSLGRVVGFADPDDYAKGDSAQDASGVVGGGSMNLTAKKGPSTGSRKPYPVVEFGMTNGTKRRVLVLPEVFKFEQPGAQPSTPPAASRTQLPLILAWAMSIHKSQGQTLDRVRVDLKKIFEKGQAYVALSRATSLEGLQVLNFKPGQVMAHPKVIQWSKSLSTIQDDL